MFSLGARFRPLYSIRQYGILKPYETVEVCNIIHTSYNTAVTSYMLEKVSSSAQVQIPCYNHFPFNNINLLSHQRNVKFREPNQYSAVALPFEMRTQVDENFAYKNSEMNQRNERRISFFCSRFVETESRFCVRCMHRFHDFAIFMCTICRNVR